MGVGMSVVIFFEGVWVWFCHCLEKVTSWAILIFLKEVGSSKSKNKARRKNLGEVLVLKSELDHDFKRWRQKFKTLKNFKGPRSSKNESWSWKNHLSDQKVKKALLNVKVTPLSFEGKWSCSSKELDLEKIPHNQKPLNSLFVDTLTYLDLIKD